MTNNKTATSSKIRKDDKQWPHWLSIALFTIISLGIWLFNKDYITPLLLGFIFAALSYPIYSFLVSKMKFRMLREGLAGGITIIVLAGAIIGLVNLMAGELVKEIPKFGNSIITFVDNIPSNESILSFASNFGLEQNDLKVLTEQIKTEAGNSSFMTGDSSETRDFSQVFSSDNLSRALDVSRQAFGYVFNQLVYLVIFILAWFNGLVNGKLWLESLFEIMPLSDTETDNIKKDLKTGMQNVIYANLLSGAINTAIVVLIMLIFGLPNVTIVAIAVFLVGTLPLSPSELGYAIPIILLFPVNPIAALILIPVSELIVLYLNYVLLPRVIAGGDGGNPLLILTSILSGISIFGLMGFIIAPVLMILIQTLYNILVERIRLEKGDVWKEEINEFVSAT
jgi:predicted PurR-regulated permease PerM